MKVLCKKDFVYSNGFQYFWTGYWYEVSEVYESGLGFTIYAIYADINTPTAAFYFSIEKSPQYDWFNDYFFYLDEWRNEKLKELGI